MARNQSCFPQPSLSPAGNINEEWEEAGGLQLQLEPICSSPWAAGDLYTALAGLWMPQLAGQGREGGQCSPEMCLLLAVPLAASGRQHLKTIFLNCTIWREEESRRSIYMRLGTPPQLLGLCHSQVPQEQGLWGSLSPGWAVPAGPGSFQLHLR